MPHEQRYDGVTEVDLAAHVGLQCRSERPHEALQILDGSLYSAVGVAVTYSGLLQRRAIVLSESGDCPLQVCDGHFLIRLDALRVRSPEP